jgi:hypothetical protein
MKTAALNLPKTLATWEPGHHLPCMLSGTAGPGLKGMRRWHKPKSRTFASSTTPPHANGQRACSGTQPGAHELGTDRHNRAAGRRLHHCYAYTSPACNLNTDTFCVSFALSREQLRLVMFTRESYRRARGIRASCSSTFQDQTGSLR